MAKCNKYLFVSKLDLDFLDKLRGLAGLDGAVLKLLKYCTIQFIYL